MAYGRPLRCRSGLAAEHRRDLARAHSLVIMIVQQQFPFRSEKEKMNVGPTGLVICLGFLVLVLAAGIIAAFVLLFRRR